MSLLVCNCQNRRYIVEIFTFFGVVRNSTFISILHQEDLTQVQPKDERAGKKYSSSKGSLLRGIVNWSVAARSVVQRTYNYLDTTLATNFLYFKYKQCWPYMVSIQKIVFRKKIIKKDWMHFVSW